MTPEGMAKEVVWHRGFDHYADRSFKALEVVKKRVAYLEECMAEGVEPPGVMVAGAEVEDAVVRLNATLQQFDTFFCDYVQLLFDVLEEQRQDRKREEGE
jgi:hypothetical protein